MALALAASVVVAGASGCSTDVASFPDGGSAAIVILPSGPVVTQPGAPAINFTASTGTTAAIAWTLAPAVGTLSTTSGRSTAYTPPSTITAPTAVTLTATLSSGPSASVSISIGAAVVPPQSIPGLTAPVTVTYDERDIPNISCAKQADCLAVQGYIHARDRLFEMDLFRRNALGELAALIGDSELDSDIQFRTLFMTRNGQRLADALVANMEVTDPATLSLVQAYARGVTTYIQQMRANDPAAPFPAEYGMLLYPVTPADIRDWTPADTLAVARLFQFSLSETLSEEIDTGRFYQTYGPGAPLQDLAKVNAWIRCQQPVPAFTLSPSLVAGGGTPAAARAPAAQLGASLPADSPELRRLSESLRGMRQMFASANERAGSNNWVVKGTSSASGKAMVANDPHLQLQYPPLFHLATLTGDGLQVLGSAFPGVPGALIGRGAHVGWGDTVVGYDVTDVYVEAVVGATPQGVPIIAFGGGTVTLIAVQQQVGVRTSVGVSNQTITILVSPPHGPVVAQLSQTQLVSMRWTGLELTNDIRAFLGLLTAPDVDGAFVALKDYATGAQNFVLADDQGNIGFDPHALVPQRPWAGTTVMLPDGPHTLLPWAPLPGVGVAEWPPAPDGGTLWVPDDQLPQGKNPAKGYFATANSAPSNIYCVPGATIVDPPNPLPAGVPYLSFSWDDPTGFRAGRIIQQLSALTDGGTVSLSNMESIQSDHVSTLAAALLPAIDRQPAGNATYDAAKAIIDQWHTNGLNCPTGLTGVDPVGSPNDPDTVNAQSSEACLLFHAFLNRLVVNVFAPSLALAGQGVNTSNAIRGILYLLTPGLPVPAQTFCAPLTCDQQVVKAMTDAYNALTVTYGQPSAGNWRWGRLHTMSPSSAAYPLVAGLYKPGPYARPGGALTVDVGNPGLRTDDALVFQYGAGSNVRFIAVMDGSATKEQLPGPVVDGPFYPGNPGLLGQYVQNQYFDFPYGASAIAAATVRTQTFSAP
ncbi:MAG TPA: penicillin acylase family protein [Myxococcaceae bacterium]|nr:penicillin acylase family protein [Myxococcaceae bacterium]